MCRECAGWGSARIGLPIWDDHGDPLKRVVPERSGEGAIYSPEYLARKEGNALGTQGERWYAFVPST